MFIVEEVLYYTEKDEYILLRKTCFEEYRHARWKRCSYIYCKANSSFQFNCRQHYIDGVFQKILHIWKKFPDIYSS